ncbi:MAG: hypothetical protein HZC02_05530 [Candidatus Levybacteria bacterium]|nr:hypothetical protein [Candidatus Levybacteria bacterium]
MRTVELRGGGTYPALTPVSNHEHRLITQANEERRARIESMQTQTSGAQTEEYPRIAPLAPVAERP